MTIKLVNIHTFTKVCGLIVSAYATGSYYYVKALKKSKLKRSRVLGLEAFCPPIPCRQDSAHDLLSSKGLIKHKTTGGRGSSSLETTKALHTA